MTGERQIGCWIHEGVPELHCRTCRADSFGWLKAAFHAELRERQLTQQTAEQTGITNPDLEGIR